jgi:peptide-methionine (S)-S-oxide reductase
MRGIGRGSGAIALAMVLAHIGGSGWAAEMETRYKKAAFAAGCFWGVEKIFSEVPGVISTQVGYMGGNTERPTYEQVCTGQTGHAETVEVLYDPTQVSYEELLATFWQWHDPTTLNRQGPDVGSQYRSVIFFYDAQQEQAARRTKEVLEKARVFRDPIVTEIVPAGRFWRAEEYHQKYLKKNPNGYCSHRIGSPRIRQVLKQEGLVR